VTTGRASVTGMPRRLAPSLVIAFALGCAGSGQNGSPGAGGGGGTAGGGGTLAGGGGAGGSNPAGGGGSGGAAGAAGAAGGAGGSGGTAGPCGGFAFCDDFEGPPAGQPPDALKWTVDLVSSTGTVSIDGSQAHGGSKSLHVNGSGGFHTMAMVKGAPVFPLPAGVLFARAYMKGPMTSAGGNHVIWIEAGSVANDVSETRFGANGGQLEINKWPGDTEQRAPSAVLTGDWQCVELMYDNAAGEVRAWLDGTELTGLHLTSWAPGYDAIRFGWELNGGSIWFDDVVLGYARIGCQ
jgi:Cip1-like, core domain